MRIASVVLPLCATLAAAGLTAIAVHHRTQPPARVVVAPMPIALQPAAPAPHQPARYEVPVGGQYLTADLLVEQTDGPPLLFLLPAGELEGYRYGWRMPRLADVMAKELAAVLDEACPAGCPRTTEARTALEALLDAEDAAAGPIRSTHWDHDDDGIAEHMHRLTTRRSAGPIALDITCTCASWTVGMRMWNDITTCDATLRDRGQVLATYSPRHLAKDTKESVYEPVDAYDQHVKLRNGDDLVIETGWNYAGDNITRPLSKTTVRGGPRWQ